MERLGMIGNGGASRFPGGKSSFMHQFLEGKFRKQSTHTAAAPAESFSCLQRKRTQKHRSCNIKLICMKHHSTQNVYYMNVYIVCCI